MFTNSIKINYIDGSHTKYLNAEWDVSGNFLIVHTMGTKIVIPLEKVATFEIIKPEQK